MTTSIQDFSLRNFSALIEQHPHSQKPSVHGNMLFVDGVSTGTLPTILRLVDETKTSDLSKTFQRSWDVVSEKTDYDLLVDQIVHYVTGYGTSFAGELHIPNTHFGVEIGEMPIRVIRGITIDTFVDRICSLLSGSAIATEMVAGIYALIVDLRDIDSGLVERIIANNKNRELEVALLDGGYIKNPSAEQVLRIISYKATESTLFIKSKQHLEKITAYVRDNPKIVLDYLRKVDISEFAAMFNRNKKVFLAMKVPYLAIRSHINRIAKLSKKLHKPWVQSPIETATSKLFTIEDIRWIEQNATSQQLLRVFDAIVSPTPNYYRIRNGKVWVDVSDGASTLEVKPAIRLANLGPIARILRDRWISKHGNDQVKIYTPPGVDYGIPSSGKAMIGAIPFGTVFSSTLSLSVGVYWKNSWGCQDIDLSSMDMDGNRIGWNSYHKNQNNIIFSGDMTDASTGAVEFITFSTREDGETHNVLVSNLYSRGANVNSQLDLVISRGKGTRNSFIKGNDIWTRQRVTHQARQQILGVATSNQHTNQFVAFTCGSSGKQVGDYGKVDKYLLQGLIEKYINRRFSFEDLLKLLRVDVEFVDSANDSNIDLTLSELSQDTWFDMF